MAFGLFGSSTGAAAPITSTPVNQTSQVKEQLKAQIAQELAVANATELVNKITSNCFEKCMSAPYSYKDEPCVDRCLEKYMRAWNSVSKIYIQRIQDASK